MAIRTAELSIALIALFSVISASVLYQLNFFASTGPQRKEYQGKIVEKTIWPCETTQGSFIERCLIIEEKDGSRSMIYVQEDTFARAKTGQWIRRTPKGIQLFSTDPVEISP